MFFGAGPLGVHVAPDLNVSGPVLASSDTGMCPEGSGVRSESVKLQSTCVSAHRKQCVQLATRSFSNAW